MKTMMFGRLQMALLAAAAAATLSACNSGVKLDDVANDDSRASADVVKRDQGANGNGTDARAVTPVDVSRDPLNDPTGPLAKRSVYFDFDSYAVKPDYQGVVDAHGKYLGESASRKVLIQGNTDERGTTEYNLALGQRRADAVRRARALRGVPESRMEAVSLGKEKPKATGHDEASWAENRRADLVY